ARVSFRLQPGWEAGPIENVHEPFPKPLTPRQIASRGSYSYPPPAYRLMPSLPLGVAWANAGRGDFHVGAGGRIDLRLPLDKGPGYYYVLVYTGRGDIS